tara:strand:+ start:5511 stop:6932 length:1422 start_codon:yes stop_codon:yes gene_type:complete
MSVLLLNNYMDTDNNITLGNPHGIQGGAYLSKIRNNDDDFLIQLNKCTTKNGIIKTDKKIYCDLVFDFDDEKTINFFTHLEDTIKNLIFEKREIWFHNDMDIDTIEYHWQSMLRQYQGNKYLLRTFIKKPKTNLSQNSLYIYDENETPLTLDDITKDKKVITIIKINSLKFTQQSFNIELFLDQVMILNDDLKPRCLIKKIDKYEKNLDSYKNLIPKESLDEVENFEINNLEDNDLEQEIILEENNNLEGGSILEKDNIVEDTENLGEDKSLEKNKDLENEELDDLETIDLDNIQNLEINRNEVSENETLNDKKTEDINNVDKEIHESPHDTESNKGIENDKQVKTIKNTEIDKKFEKNKDLENDVNDIEKNNIKNDISLAINSKKNDYKDKKQLFNLGELDEIDINIADNDDILNLKPPNEVYNAIYKEVRKKAKEAKKRAIEAYLEVKRIKSLYGLQDIESSDEENSNDNF